MSTHVATITSGIKTIVASVLGSTYSELPYSYSVEENTSARVRKGYAVVPLGAEQTDGTNRTITTDQQFQIVLYEFYLSSQVSDTNENTVIVSLYEKMFDIYASLISLKAGASSVVLLVNGMSIADPEILSDNDFITMRMNVNIKHRYSF